MTKISGIDALVLDDGMSATCRGHVRQVECVDCEHGPAPLANKLDFTPVSPAIRAVEKPLFESGAMLRRYRRTTQGGRVEIVV